MTDMRRNAFDQGLTEPRYAIKHQWAGNGRGKVVAVVMQDNGGHLPVAELAYRTAKGRGEIAVGRLDVHPAHQGRGLEQQLHSKLAAEYPGVEIR